jgi:hypothetical protein
VGNGSDAEPDPNRRVIVGLVVAILVAAAIVLIMAIPAAATEAVTTDRPVRLVAVSPLAHRLAGPCEFIRLNLALPPCASTSGLLQGTVARANREDESPLPEPAEVDQFRPG